VSNPLLRDITATISDVGVMSGMHNIGTYKVKFTNI